VRAVDDGDRVLVSLSRGEEVVGQLTRFCHDRGFPQAGIEGIGAIEGITIGAYDLERRVYRKQELAHGWEVLGFNGNFSWISGEPLLHTHVTLADLDGQVRGGHLFAATVHITLELILRPGKVRVERGLDKACGLNLWQLDS
jgi:predicted DNA-binding protein with PD1-like motif